MTDNASTVSPTDPAATKLHAPKVAADSQPKKDTSKQKKTWGEHIFNWGTYGGFTLLGNEVTSTIIMEQTKQGKILQKPFEASQEKLSGWLKGVKSNYIHEGMFNYILWACIGGFFMVWPVKALEDHKDGIVRWIDRRLHGGKETPELEKAHEEMDHKPKQTWRSLGEGRVLVVVFAQVVHSLVGWPKSVFAKWTDKTFNSATRRDVLIRDFSSYERASMTASRFVTKLIDKDHRAAIDNVMATVHDVGERYKPQRAEGKVLPFVSTATNLMSLSALLTVMFYVSSKLFAKKIEEKKEEKIERKLEHQIAKANGTSADMAEDVPEMAPATAPVEHSVGLSAKTTSDKPTPQVKSISRDETLATVPQLSQALN